jgi:hypothetical protein
MHKSVGEYLARAVKFDDMANATSLPVLQKRFSDIAECYRLLADDRLETQHGPSIGTQRCPVVIAVPSRKTSTFEPRQRGVAAHS